MRTKEGKTIVSCCMTDDTERFGPCATCLHYRSLVNTRSLKEGDPSYCDDHSVITKDGE